MFNIDECTDACRTLSDMLVQVTKELLDLMNELKLNGCRSKQTYQKIVNINEIESKADTLFRKTVAQLFKNETDPLTVMKWKEIYQIMENTIDNCQKLASIVEGVVIKNA
jgi:uncharacterized protein Yka (UPF0111/DUF47 family)